jgi:hypothetical protein
MSVELAAVEVVRCKADKRGDLFAAHLAKLGDNAMRVKARVWPTPRIEVSKS